MTAATVALACLTVLFQQPQDARTEFEKASKLFAAGAYEAALPHFQRAYIYSKKRPSTIIALAQCERALKRYDSAIKHFREYIAANPPADEVARATVTIAELIELAVREKLGLAQHLFDEGDYDAAHVLLTAANELAPDRPATLRALAACEREMEKTKADEPPAEDRAERAAKADVTNQLPPGDQPALTAAPSVETDASKNEDDSMLASPWFWIAGGVATILGIVVVAELVSPPEHGGGTVGVKLEYARE